jgi:hypothetical protein
MEKIVIVLFFILAVFSVAFSATSDVEDVNTVVKIWTEIQEYVSAQEFFYGSNEENDHHTEYVSLEILAHYGITNPDDYVVAVLGTLEYRPIILLVAFELNGIEYKRSFKIKHVKEKEIKDGCDDPSRCA